MIDDLPTPLGEKLKLFATDLSATLFLLYFRRIFVHVLARSKSHIDNSKHA